MKPVLKTLAPRALTNLLAVALMLTATLTAQAGTRDAGGGTGININGRLTVLDLVEAGVENDPYLPNITPDANIVRILSENLRAPDELRDEIIMPLAAKLTDIDQVVHPAGFYMAAATSLYEFKLTSLKLNNIDDTDSAIGEPKTQIAERKGSQIWINRESWNALDTANKVALMVHEIVYAYQPAPTLPHEVSTYGGLFRGNETSVEGGTEVDQILGTSAKTRVLTGFFFRSDWHKNWQKRLDYDLKYSDSAYTFSNLYGFMVESVGNKSRVVNFKVEKQDPENTWNTDHVGNLQPIFSQLYVYGIRRIYRYGEKNTPQYNDVQLTLRADASVKELYNLCAKASRPAETVGTYSSVFIFSAQTGNRQDEKFDYTVGTKNIAKDLSHVTLSDEGQPTSGANSVAMVVTSGKIDSCVQGLRKVQKEYMVR
ncbi:MAG: hypothetical protein ACXWQO_07350 [Bdellovibrionota bacterium]